jgi:RecA-family ATPase
MRRVLDVLTKVCIANHMVPIIVHHKGKGDIDGTYSSRGASAISDWASTIINLSKKKLNDEPTIQITNSKARSFETFSSFNIKMTMNFGFDCITTDKFKSIILNIIKKNQSFNNRKSFLQEIKKNVSITDKMALGIIKDLVKSNDIIKEKGAKNALKYSYNTKVN